MCKRFLPSAGSSRAGSSCMLVPILFVAPSLRGDLFDNVLLTRLCAGLYALPAWRRMRGEADPSVSAPELTPTHMWRAILRCSLANTDWWGMDGDSLFVACKEDLEERDQNRGRCLGSTNCSKVPFAFLLPARGLHVNCGSGPICTLHRRICSYTRAGSANVVTLDTTLGSANVSSAQTALVGRQATWAR